MKEADLQIKSTQRQTNKEKRSMTDIQTDKNTDIDKRKNGQFHDILAEKHRKWNKVNN